MGKVSKNRGASARPKAAAKKKLARRASRLYEIFSRAGFKHIKSDSIEIVLDQRKCEIDHVFFFENLLILCEERGGSSDIAKHFINKAYFHRIVANDFGRFCSEYRKVNSEFDGFLSSSGYLPDELEVRHIYHSESVDCALAGSDSIEPFQIMTVAEGRYFQTLCKSIQRSARYELLKYLRVSLSRLGESKLSGSGAASNDFPAFALSSGHTNFPPGFAIVSFYADPQSIISRAYVMRREGWEHPATSYQRFLTPGKLGKMREYLARNGQVFINNLIVTLPPTMVLKTTDGVPIDVNAFRKEEAVLTLPLELGTVGIVDGQHRVLAYYEGEDQWEPTIANLRKRQNLLVTGIVFPPSYTSHERVKFEANLFLTINTTQSRVLAALKQELELITKPESSTALAKAVINKLSQVGALKGLIKANMYDGSDKIRTASLVRYVLLPLMRPDAGNPLFSAWNPLGNKSMDQAGDREEYIDYCHAAIDNVMVAARGKLLGRWLVASKDGPGVLTPTTVGGLIMCLRDVILARREAAFSTSPPNGFPRLNVDFDSGLAELGGFDFSPYTSSAWTELGAELQRKYFP